MIEAGQNTRALVVIYLDAVNVFEHAINRPMDIPPKTRFRYRSSDPLTLGRIIRQTVEARGEDCD